eukprot:scaffold60253_cov29-Tisochrysis_lutea.AAC.2
MKGSETSSCCRASVVSIDIPIVDDNEENTCISCLNFAWVLTTPRRLPLLGEGLPSHRLGALAELSVHSVDFLAVSRKELRPLQLEGRGEAVILNSESLAEVVDVPLDMHRLRDLKSMQLGGLAACLDLAQYEGGHLGLGEHISSSRPRRRPARVHSVRHHFLHVGSADRNELGGVRVAVDEELRDVCRLSEKVLDLFGSNVFSLRELEDVLLAVDNRKRAIGIPPADVASVQPAIFTECLCGRLRVLVVADEVDGAAGENLAARGVAR